MSVKGGPTRTPLFGQLDRSLRAHLGDLLSRARHGDEEVAIDLARVEVPKIVTALRALLDEHHPDAHGRCPTCRTRRFGRHLPAPCRAYLAAHLCLVIADGDKIWFSLGDPDLNDTRLAAAAAVYGLSPAQHQVARLIVEGLSLGEIGERLGVSMTTARTHLNRVFDKTGVSRQADLVKLMMRLAGS